MPLKRFPSWLGFNEWTLLIRRWWFCFSSRIQMSTALSRQNRIGDLGMDSFYLRIITESVFLRRLQIRMRSSLQEDRWTSIGSRLFHIPGWIWASRERVDGGAWSWFGVHLVFSRLNWRISFLYATPPSPEPELLEDWPLGTQFRKKEKPILPQSPF